MIKVKIKMTMIKKILKILTKRKEKARMLQEKEKVKSIFLEILMPLKNVKNLDPGRSTVVENAYYLYRQNDLYESLKFVHYCIRYQS